jgi:hypothetical protein
MGNHAKPRERKSDVIVDFCQPSESFLDNPAWSPFHGQLFTAQHGESFPATALRSNEPSSTCLDLPFCVGARSCPPLLASPAATARRSPSSFILRIWNRAISFCLLIHHRLASGPTQEMTHELVGQTFCSLICDVGDSSTGRNEDQAITHRASPRRSQQLWSAITRRSRKRPRRRQPRTTLSDTLTSPTPLGGGDCSRVLEQRTTMLSGACKVVILP